MEFKKDEINDLIQEVTSFKDINLSDIPDIDLYMDQVITLFEKKLGDLKRDKNEKIMTKTMINNYAKAKILPPVKGKKYNKEQIILINLIYNLKQNLSINDIGSLFQPISKDTPVEEIYQAFLDIKKSQEEVAKNQIKELVNIIKDKGHFIKDRNNDYIEIILLVLSLINRANIEKRLAEKIIDKFL
ncbi:DUF1836 domain-containing protein [Clostridium malenominatum]|uniref:DUF1836 domain-containing protein n=1 Tax=Clostridium malenominatum TaxID=1539 RepID=A0ABN1J398_9CLOT